MDLAKKQEQFSLAYLKAIASIAGCSFTEPSVDEGVDVVFETTEISGVLSSPVLHAQVKSFREDTPQNGILRYGLKVKNYNDLVLHRAVPMILIVVSVPKELDLWFEQGGDGLTIQRCAYWASFRGQAPSPNNSTVTIDIDRASIFSPDELRRLLQIMANGGLR